MWRYASITRHQLTAKYPTNVWPLMVGFVLVWSIPADAAADGSVLCAPGDPYRPLASEIADQTGFGLVDRPETALTSDPTYLIWVAAPTHFSDRDLVAYAMQVRDRPSSISLGFITGRTLEQARALWQRGSQPRGTRFAIANGVDPHTGRFSNRLVSVVGNERTETPLTLARLQAVLVTADYVTFTGHGTPTRLRLDRQTDLRMGEVPVLAGLVLSSSSCNSFRFWQEDSLLLTFIEQGVTAYAGFAYSPNGGYLQGAYDDLPLRHTWPEFPIGHAVQVLNRGSRQGFANFPFFLLAGDPRTSLRRDRPYEIVEDRIASRERVLRLRGVAPGLLPVRIPDGAAYRFVRIPGTAAASANDWFYNARLQMADIAADKYLLVLQPGGEITIQLSPEPPPWWTAMSCVAALDSTLIFAMRHSFDLFQSVTGGVAWLAVGFSMRKRRSPGAVLTPILLGLALAAGHGLYMAFRLEHVVITSKPLGIAWLGMVGTFLTASSGAWLFINGRRTAIRWLGLLLPGLLFLLTALVVGVVMGCLGWLVAQRIGAPAWNFHLVWPHLITLMLVLPVWAAVVQIARPARLTGRPSEAAGAPEFSRPKLETCRKY